jgi:Leucine-rich repeat (LRR) protein
LLSKLLGENSVLTTLNLADNQVHSEGGRYLARGLRENDSLLQLNVRLNRLADEGCCLLLEGLRDNVSLTDLNIGSNAAGSASAQVLFTIIRDPEHNLQTLDISGNELDNEQFELMRASINNNKTLTSLDMRRNPGYSESKSRFMFLVFICLYDETNLYYYFFPFFVASKAIAEIERTVHGNELRARANGH